MLNKPKHYLLTLCAVAGLTLLVGCTDRVMLANEKMADIRASDARPVEPAPEPQLVEEYVYNAADVRSPFMPPSLLSQQQIVENTDGIQPDFERKKQPLENYELSQLVYRGMIVSPQGVEYGLIERPDGVIARAKVGDYMGMNHGRILEITPTQMNLIEIVPDNRAGYREKPASVVSPI